MQRRLVRWHVQGWRGCLSRLWSVQSLYNFILTAMCLMNFQPSICLFLVVSCYSLCERSTLWVYFFSQICCHDKSNIFIRGLNIRLKTKRLKHYLSWGLFYKAFYTLKLIFKCLTAWTTLKTIAALHWNFA